MFATAAQPNETDYDDGYIPLKIRFAAWWEGVEPRTLVRKNLASPSIASPAQASEFDRAPDEPPDPDWVAEHGREIDVDLPTEAPALIWPKTRLDLASVLWGLDDEVVSPGGVAYSQRLVEPMALCKGRRFLDLSAGLGGGARAICMASDADVDGVDLDPELAAHAMVLSIQRGLNERVPIKHLNPDRADLGSAKYDGVLAREMMFQLADRDGLLKSVHTALKPHGHFVFTDFVLAEGVSRDDPDVWDWLDSERDGVAPAPIDYYRNRIELLGFDLQEETFECETYCSFILRAWAQFMANLAKDTLTREYVSAMILEAEFWMKRVKVLNSGKVRLLRCHATKGTL